MEWSEQKRQLEKNMRRLKEKLTSAEITITNLSAQLKEAREQNEDVEFRLLELQEGYDKVCMKLI